MNRFCQEHACGAHAVKEGIRFLVWAPAAQKIEVEIEGARHSLSKDADGYFSATVEQASVGALYRYVVDGAGPYPDPCSRYQPDGVHGPSMVVDPTSFQWTDAEWRGAELKGQVIYELHMGTFTPEGTFDAAAQQLRELKDLGVTMLEVMPVAEFPGRFNWGYDGVGLYAPYHGYGDPDAFKRFVDAAHREGLAVILDVVYNHLGPDGNYLPFYSKDYFTDRYANEWGESINFDGPNATPVREFFIRNACYWIGEFHLDGLRLDATQSIHDASATHVLAELSQRARAAAGSRKIVLIAENEPQQAQQLLPGEAGGYGLDGMWNDDFHHSARVALTGRHEGYFHDYRGRAQEFISAAKYGFLFQGQYYHWQHKPRGTPTTGQPAWAFIIFIQNHDQVANTLSGERIGVLTSPGRHRAMTALMLLSPQTPMLFMGQEYGATQPFTFFADHKQDLARKVHSGRREFVAQFEPYATGPAQARVPDPADDETFNRCKLDFAERAQHQPIYDLHKDLLRLRREDPVIAQQDRQRIDGAVLSDRAFVLRWFDAEHGDRLLIVNFGEEAEIHPAPEPLLAPPLDRDWQLLWSSDEPHYGGFGAVSPYSDRGWRVSGETATLLSSTPRMRGV